MIYVRVEIWPFGQREKARLIGEMKIGNVDTRYVGTRQVADYQVVATDDRSTGFSGNIVDHDRSMSIWALLKSALRAVRP